VVLNAASVVQLLEMILAELQRMNNERSGGVSSVEIEDLVAKPPKVTTKHYAGSEPPIDDAIADHAYAKRMANAAYMRDWEATLDQLKEVAG